MLEKSDTFDQNPEQKKFNFGEWKSEGEKNLESLTQREAALQEELAEVQKQMDGLQGVLGRVKPTKRKIRPVLKRKLMEAGDTGKPFQALVQLVAEELGVKPKAVETALLRFEAADDYVTIENSPERTVRRLVPVGEKK